MNSNPHRRIYKANRANVPAIKYGMEVYVTDTTHGYYCEVGKVEQVNTNSQGTREARVWFAQANHSEWLRFDQLAICR